MTKMAAAYRLERLLKAALSEGQRAAQLAQARRVPRRSSPTRLRRVELALVKAK